MQKHFITRPALCHLRRAAVLGIVVALGPIHGALAQPLTVPGLGFAPGGATSGPLVEVRAHFSVPDGGNRGTLWVRADIQNRYHIYSITQPKGGPQRTQIRLDASADYQQAGPFRADPPPVTHEDTEVWVGLQLEEHFDHVTWSAPVEFSSGVDPKRVTIAGVVDSQVCDPSTCIPLKISFTAKRVDPKVVATVAAAGVASPSAGPDLNRPVLEGPPSSGSYRAEQARITIHGHLEPATAAPGGSTTLVLSAAPDPRWHIYALADRDPKQISKPTLIVVDGPTGLSVGRATTDAPVVEKDQRELGLGVERYHEGRVTWRVPIAIPAGTAPGSRTVTGIMGYQVCTETGCRPPSAVRFQVPLEIGDRPVSGSVPVTFAKAKYAEAAIAARQVPVPPRGPAGTGEFNTIVVDGDEQFSLASMLLFGFLGGLILNLMPCVLPVIGLKLMSFVEQAGHSRGRALMLNVWYSVGIVSVFLLLAALAVGAGMTWGEQFGSDTFNITLAVIVFAMALSLLGVWEIPIPGFVGGSRATDLSQTEGPVGALIKGMITTVLATPCTGPFMGAALAWAVRQNAQTTYAVFGAMGLGMSSPYLLLGLFPQLIQWLPRPGAWMVTFKQIMGFVLLGTVIYLLTFIHPALVVPTAMLLAGVAAGCWWIARTPVTSSRAARFGAWAGGIAIAMLVGVGAFGWLDNVMAYRFNRLVARSDQEVAVAAGEHDLPWQPYTPERLRELTGQQTTVLVDFTADWCATCKTLEKLVLNTADVKAVVKRNGVATLVADYTKRSPTVKRTLARLKSNGVPVVAIFPAGNADRPIVFRGMYTQSALIDALKQAGPSHGLAGDAVATLPGTD